MADNKHLPAYPIVESVNSESVELGLTKRELIAAMSLQGLLASGYKICGYGIDNRDKVAQIATDVADALLIRLQNTEK